MLGDTPPQATVEVCLFFTKLNMVGKLMYSSLSDIRGRKRQMTGKNHNKRECGDFNICSYDI